MKKLTLKLDDLTVVSFVADADGAGGGTVLAHTDRYTDCWGGCGVNTVDGGICYQSDVCTQDPNAGDCRSNFYESRCMQTYCDGISCGGQDYCP